MVVNIYFLFIVFILFYPKQINFENTLKERVKYFHIKSLFILYMVTSNPFLKVEIYLNNWQDQILQTKSKDTVKYKTAEICFSIILHIVKSLSSLNLSMTVVNMLGS